MRSTGCAGLQLLVRRIVAGCACLALVACYSFEPIGGAPTQLREALHAGQLVKVGDHLQLRTTSGERVEFEVVSVDTDALHGDGRVIAIEDIAALQRRQYSVGKTLLLVAGITLLVVGAAASAASGDVNGITIFGTSTAGG